MKKSFKILVITLLLALFVSCTALYNNLLKEYGPSNLETVPSSSTTKNSSTSSTQSNTDNNPTEDDKNPIEFSAPDFTVLDINGNEVRLSSFAGKPIVINFWGSWCGYCKQEMPDFQKMYEKYPNVQFVMINSGDTISTAKSYIEQNGFTFPVFFDTTDEAVIAYGVTAFPYSFFINAEGEYVAYARGMISASQLESGIKMITEE